MCINMDPLSAPGNEHHKRSLWQWATIYFILALIVYGFMRYSVPPASAPATPSEVSSEVVTLTDMGFSPSELSIKKGAVVTFTNASPQNMRVASNPHPIHDEYPTRGGCISSTFDSCAKVAPGQSWSFAFDAVGTWGYHDHLHPSFAGTIVVQ